MSANQEGKDRQFVFDRCKQLKGARAEMGLYVWYLLYCDIYHFGFSHGVLLEERYVSCICDTVTL